MERILLLFEFHLLPHSGLKIHYRNILLEVCIQLSDVDNLKAGWLKHNKLFLQQSMKGTTISSGGSSGTPIKYLLLTPINFQLDRFSN